jgi:HEAT repeat protein
MGYNRKYHYYDEKSTVPEKPSLKATLDAIRAGEHGKLTSTVFYGLSELSPEDADAVREVWAALDPAYRRKLAQRMAEASETNFDLDYAAIGRIALDDPDAEVRQFAIEMLAEDRDLALMERYIEIAMNDESISVRAASASALGAFILAGELGELPEAETRKAQRAMLRLFEDQSQAVDVRRRALEALSNCGHPQVPDAIRRAYANSERRMRLSAVYAMGRTCDAAWRDIVLYELGSEDPEMRFEAARAAGELELREAVAALAQLGRDSDREIRDVAIWSLGEIGGEDSLRVLRMFLREAERARDADWVEVIEDAIASANIGGGDLLES